MKKFIVLFLFAVLASCNTQKKYSDFDYSYSRSGGFAPVYENFLIKGNSAHYSFEGQGKKFTKDFTVTDEELKSIETALTKNNFRFIQEDRQKVYDNITIAINVKKGNNSGSKSDASFIMAKDKKRWENVVATFQNIINTKITTATTK